MIPKQAERKATEARPIPVSADEERDWGGFRTYLRELTAEGLWDAYTHVDADRYPRRREAIEREMTRRNLFFVSPYTEPEQRTRLLGLNLVLFSVLATVLHHIPNATGAINRMAVGLNNDVPLLSPAGRAVSLVSGLTRRETEVMNALSTLFGGVATLLLIATVFLLPYLVVRLRRRRLRPDVLSFALIAVGAGVVLLLLRR